MFTTTCGLRCLNLTAWMKRSKPKSTVPMETPHRHHSSPTTTHQRGQDVWRWQILPAPGQIFREESEFSRGKSEKLINGREGAEKKMERGTFMRTLKTFSCWVTKKLKHTSMLCYSFTLGFQAWRCVFDLELLYSTRGRCGIGFHVTSSDCLTCRGRCV